jgi:signal transduction histidine kinase
MLEALVILGTIVSLYYVRVLTVERRNRELAIQVAERTAAEEEIRALSERLINAQEEERTRIARELHDNLNQQIAGISLALGAAKRDLSKSRVSTNEPLEQVRTQLDNLANTIRELSHELHPAALDYCDLPAALQAHCKEFSSLTGITIEFVDEGPFEDVTPEVALCLFRVTQEALQNIAKHARTDFAEVHLLRNGDSATLIISDRGKGFSVDRRRSHKGLGLVSIKERVRLVKGRFELKSEPDRGTTIRIEVPVHTEAQVAERS